MSTPISRPVKVSLLCVADTLAVIGAGWLAYYIAFNEKLPDDPQSFLTQVVLPATLWFLAVAAIRGLYRVRARYVGLYDFLNVGVIALLCGLFLYFAPPVWNAPVRSLSASILFAGLVCLALISSRVALRLYSWRQFPFRLIPRPSQKIRLLVVGAGDAGEMIIRELQKSRDNRRVVTGLIDDDPEKQALIIQGIRVMGGTSDIPRIVEALSIEEIVIAVPSASGQEMRRIVDICKQTRARVRTLPSVVRLLTAGTNLQTHLRDVEIEDLLRREPAKADPAKIAGYVRGETVLITGGGGSIGSELARQIAHLSPGHLVLLGKGENSLYEVEQEIRHTSPQEPAAIVADVRSPQSIEFALNKYKPTLVFHAAAHKHVPLMQSNPIEAIQNNVFGTLNMAEGAVRYGVKRFVYISTDKAVNPTSVMGATKRVGEMIISAMANHSETSFGIVRFGNVLGSRGSLIPLLKSQIERGGPVRVTHPDMTRYFMTIPEAVQLILHAGASGSAGELFILDMGEPVRILDLAQDLIRLYGLEPYKDIEIKFIGIRPGEKTHEELVYSQEELKSTDHPKIQTAKSRPYDYSWLMKELATLRELCDSGDQEAARAFLMDMANGRTAYGVVQISESTERTVL